MRANKNWTAEEIEYLSEHFGQSSYGTLAKNLGRSVEAIKIKATKLKLGAFLQNGEYITFHQLLATLGYLFFTSAMGVTLLMWSNEE